MTYCLAIALQNGLVFASDSRTNAGVDNVSTYSKMHMFGNQSDREFVILSSGNLATTQAVIGQVRKDIKEMMPVNLMTVDSITSAADYLGDLARVISEKHASSGTVNFDANFIIGGQVLGHDPKVCLVYPQGNHITTSKDTPFLQIGESKYGKPILDRILTPETTIETASLCALVSIDSTMSSNLTVGPPIEVSIYQKDAYVIDRHFRFDEDSEYLKEVKSQWNTYLIEAFNKLPPINWSGGYANTEVKQPAEQNQAQGQTQGQPQGQGQG